MKANFNSEHAKITDVSYDLCSLLGYEKDDLVTRPITKLMLPVIAQKHPKYIQRFYEKMEAKSMYTELSNYVQNKEGYYLPTTLNLRMMPHLDEGKLEIMVFIREKQAIVKIGTAKILTDKKVLNTYC